MPTTFSDRHAALVRKRDELIVERDNLKTEHSKALINGTEFLEKRRLSDLNHEIDAHVAAVETADELRKAEAQINHALSQAEQSDQTVIELERHEQEYLEHAASFGEHLLKMTAAAHGMHASGRSIEAIGTKATSSTDLRQFHEPNVANRISQFIAIALQQRFNNAQGVYGVLKWMLLRDEDFPAGPLEAEQLALKGSADHVKRALKGRAAEFRLQAAAE